MGVIFAHFQMDFSVVKSIYFSFTALSTGGLEVSWRVRGGRGGRMFCDQITLKRSSYFAAGVARLDRLASPGSARGQRLGVVFHGHVSCWSSTFRFLTRLAVFLIDTALVQRTPTK